MKRPFLWMAALLFTSQLTAQDSLYKPMDEVVVTANKFSQKQNQTGKVITVINSITLQQNQGKTLASVLNNQAGLMVNGAENANGTNMSIYTRGASTQYTAVLINGIPVTDPSGVYSFFDLNTIPIEQVERVEILKGGQSTLYGSDASAGVINIILKKGAPAKWSGQAQLAAGTYNTFKGNAGISGNSGGFHYMANYARHDTRGFSTAYDRQGGNGFDRDAFTQDAVNATVGYKKNDYGISLFANYSKYKAGLDDAAFTDDRDYDATSKNLVSGVQSQLDFNKGAWIVQYSHQQHKRLHLNDKGYIAPGSFTTYFKGEFEGRNDVAETYVRLQPLANLQLVAGGDFRRASYNNTNDYGFGPSTLSKDSINTTTYAAYVSGAYQPNKAVNIEAGVRYTGHSEYGNNITWNINPSIGVNDVIRVFANLSTAFRAPSLDELFAPGYGNRNLDAEKSMSWDAGFSFGGNNKRLNLRLATFTRRVKDVIVYRVTDPNTFSGMYFNSNEQQEEGLEAELRYQPCKSWNITANYTSVQGRVKEGNKTEDNLYRRPRHLLNVGVQYTPNSNWVINAAFKAVGKRTDAAFPGPVMLNRYYTTDLYLQYNASKNLRVYTDFRNLTNQLYFDIYGYNSRRFNMMAGVQLSF